MQIILKLNFLINRSVIPRLWTQKHDVHGQWWRRKGQWWWHIVHAWQGCERFVLRLRHWCTPFWLLLTREKDRHTLRRHAHGQSRARKKWSTMNCLTSSLTRRKLQFKTISHTWDHLLMSSSCSVHSSTKVKAKRQIPRKVQSSLSSKVTPSDTCTRLYYWICHHLCSEQCKWKHFHKSCLKLSRVPKIWTCLECKKLL